MSERTSLLMGVRGATMEGGFNPLKRPLAGGVASGGLTCDGPACSWVTSVLSASPCRCACWKLLEVALSFSLGRRKLSWEARLLSRNRASCALSGVFPDACVDLDSEFSMPHGTCARVTDCALEHPRDCLELAPASHCDCRFTRGLGVARSSASICLTQTHLCCAWGAGSVGMQRMGVQELMHTDGESTNFEERGKFPSSEPLTVYCELTTLSMN